MSGGATPPTPERETRRVPLAALLVASGVSELGNVLAAVAVPWFVLQTTGSAAKTGIATAAIVLAFVLSGFFGGPVVDRLGLKTASVISDVASCLSVTAIPLLYHAAGIAFWQLVVLVFVGALLDAPGRAARQSLLPELAFRAGTTTERANSAYGGMGRLAQLLGAPLAGVLVVALGPANVLLVDAATFVFSAVTFLIAVPGPTQDRESKVGSEGYAGYAAELAAGLRFIRRNALVFWIFFTYTVTEFLDAPLETVALPVYADTVLGSPTALGAMLAGLGGGALAGNFLYGLVGHRLPRWPTYVVSLVLLQLPFWVLAATPSSVVIAVGALAVTGMAAGPINALLYTVIQERTPPGMLGRVFGALSAFGMAAVPLGMVLCGYLIEAIGLRTTLVATAACYLSVTGLVVINPALKRMGDKRPCDAEAPQ
jgi:predicted MFS family arabinose efflux permease